MSKKKSEKPVKEKKHAARKSKAPVATVPEPVTPESRPKAKKAKAAPRKKVASISPEEIGLRAYYIAERRQKMGWHGDSTSDWVEAERQLKAEAAKKKAGRSDK
ncbi:MAG: DUF2934 domain-containing protein [Chthoniobacterales bacterium]|nr:DUF2934 domain-containing protein [Chthoniobacterales bacterium]